MVQGGWAAEGGLQGGDGTAARSTLPTLTTYANPAADENHCQANCLAANVPQLLVNPLTPATLPGQTGIHHPFGNAPEKPHTHGLITDIP